MVIYGPSINSEDNTKSDEEDCNHNTLRSDLSQHDLIIVAGSLQLHILLRKRTSRRRHESLQLIQSLYEACPDSVSIVDEDGN